MTVMELLKRRVRPDIWAKLLPAVVAAGLLAGCVVTPAYGPGYYRGYYAPGYSYYPYYRDRDDYYYRRW